LIFALVVVCVGGVFIVDHYWFAFYLHSIAQRRFLFFRHCYVKRILFFVFIE
jgi:hypothetical protein